MAQYSSQEILASSVHPECTGTGSRLMAYFEYAVDTPAHSSESEEATVGGCGEEKGGI